MLCCPWNSLRRKIRGLNQRPLQIQSWKPVLWIRIRQYFVRIRILPSSSKKSKKTLDFFYSVFCTSFQLLSVKTDANVPSKSIKQKNFGKKNYFCWHLVSYWRNEIVGSGSVSQRHGSENSDQYQNLMDPRHCWQPLASPHPIRLKS